MELTVITEAWEQEHGECIGECSACGAAQGKKKYECNCTPSDREIADLYNRAERDVIAMRKEYEKDPDFDGWDFHAAESMRQPHEFYRQQVERRVDQLIAERNKEE